MTLRTHLIPAVAGLLATAGSALAQDAYPTKQVRVVVPFPAGGTTDMLARLFWTVLKGLALYWLLAKDHQWTTAALLLGFVSCWCLAFWGLALRGPRSGAETKAKT